MKRLLIGLLLLTFAQRASCGQSDMEHTFQVGEINYFGYAGVDLAAVRAQLPLHVGDSRTFATSTEPIEAAIARITGQSPTEVHVVCCDEAKRLLVYIGLGGTSSRTLVAVPTPHGLDHLDPEALRLYDEDMEALVHAMAAGNGGEDDSQGYTLANDPTLHRINLAMRAFAVTREAEFIRVLQRASDSRQRVAAAAFLGYVQRSTAQVEALAQAVGDPDGDVRNNAVRALEVLSASHNGPPLAIDPQPIIAMLFSGKWSDRNKSSFLLFRLTEGRDPKLLAALRQKAMLALIEGASWSGDPGHSYAFLMILGRIAGMPEGKLQKLVATHDSAGIIAAASAVHR